MATVSQISVTKLTTNTDAITADLDRFESGADPTLDTENIRDLIFEVEQLRAQNEGLQATLEQALQEVALHFDSGDLFRKRMARIIEPALTRDKAS